jgi:hypothetical protein
MSQVFRFCPDCRAERLFEQYHDAPGGCPDSADGHCPEWSCTSCGAALLAGSLPGLVAADGSRDIPAHHIPSKVA